jgi:hypothetical protein
LIEEIPYLLERFKECSIIRSDYKERYFINYNIFVENTNIFKKWFNETYTGINGTLNTVKNNLNSLDIAGFTRLKGLGDYILSTFNYP